MTDRQEGKPTAPRTLAGQEERVFPIMRHRSFLDGAKGAPTIVSRHHTAETIVLYACDVGEGYFLISHAMLTEAGLSEDALHRLALNNLRALPMKSRTEELGGNRITFISPPDGYAASRILLDDLLESHETHKKGTHLGVAIPHQDVLIIADLADEKGAQLLARLTMDFASKGDTPICPIPFLYEKGEWEMFLIV
ncbi:DUF1444 family protein [Brevibacillus fluminis]|uniref:DUF1444 family protein n=1 Tax=Brevibacillus fluminis TaxID=511487 RepID=UPI003F89BE45